MTKKQILTYLALGLKVRRERWHGYLYMENGVIYKYQGLNKVSTKVTTIDIYINPKNMRKWEIVP